MTVATEAQLIAPHGGYLVDRMGSRPENVDSLEQIPLASRVFTRRSRSTLPAR